MKSKFFEANNLINTILAIFIAYAWWTILPNVVEKVLAIIAIALLYIGAYFAGTYFDKSAVGINLRKSADKLDNEMVSLFKKIPVVSSRAFWLFVISAFVSWLYYQENNVAVSANIFMIILLFTNPFLDAALFKIVEPLRDRMFAVKSLKDKIIWMVLTAVVVLTITGPYIYFVYNIIMNILAKPLI